VTEDFLSRETSRASFLDEFFDRFAAAMNHQNSLLGTKFAELISAIENLTKSLAEKGNEITVGMDNISQLLNTKLTSVDEHVWLVGNKSADVVHGIDNLSRLINDKLNSVVKQQVQQGNTLSEPERILEGTLLSMQRPSDNAVFLEIARLRKGVRITFETWLPILQNAAEEIKSVPKTQKIIELLSSHAVRQSDNAFLLFWLVRRLKSRKIVQVAEVAGLSSLLMVIAAASNDRAGQLHLLGGLTAKEDQAAGRLLPDEYRTNFKIEGGDPRIVLPNIIDELQKVDLFVTGFGRTHAQILRDLLSVKGKISKGGAAVVCGGSYTGMIQCFAEQHGVPVLDFNGSLAVAFL
jgi:hypothetical protein